MVEYANNRRHVLPGFIGALLVLALMALLWLTNQRLNDAYAEIHDDRIAIEVLRSQVSALGEDPVVDGTSDPGLGGSVQILSGEQGPQGPQGERGPQGPQGLQGVAGQPGVNGSNGVDGADGINGSDGQNGVNGADGNPGPPGPQGEPGEPGPQGPAGEPGTNGQPPSSFTFTHLSVTYTCTDPDADGNYTCEPT